MAIVAVILTATYAKSAEDPRNNFDADVVVTFCKKKVCRTEHVIGPYLIEFYGAVENQIAYQRKMSMSWCKGFISSPMGFVEVQAQIAKQIFPDERVEKITCDFSGTQEI